MSQDNDRYIITAKGRQILAESKTCKFCFGIKGSPASECPTCKDASRPCSCHRGIA